MNLPKDMLRHIYIEVFPAADFAPEDIEAFWVLSTGRCGTATMDRLLSLSPQVASFHEPMPRLHEYHVDALNNGVKQEILSPLIKASRIDIVSFVASQGLKYAECQHRWSLFAPCVKNVFPKTRFIYLRRDMDEFVSSALQWHWYDIGDLGCNDPAERMAEFWCRTNERIIEFLGTIGKGEWYYMDFSTIRAHDWNRILEVYDWMGVTRPHEVEIERVLNEKLNKGRGEHIKKRWGVFDERSEKICRAVSG